MSVPLFLLLVTLSSAQRLRVRGTGGDVLFDRNGDDSMLSSIKQGADGSLIVSSDMEVSGTSISQLALDLASAQSAIDDAAADRLAKQALIDDLRADLTAAEGTIAGLVDEMTVARSNIVVLHSTTASEPTLAGATKLWGGYSFAGFMLTGSGGMHDLTQPSSCLPEFKFQPVFECGSATNCDLQTDDDYGFWLTIQTTARLTISTLPADLSKVSRCAVFDAPFPVVPKHGFTTSIPAAPPGWSTVATGYSLAGLRASGGDVGNGSPLACLPEFSPMPFFECRGASCTSDTSGDIAGWLFGGSQSTTDTGSLSGTTLRNQIARCAFFKKNLP